MDTLDPCPIHGFRHPHVRQWECADMYQAPSYPTPPPGYRMPIRVLIAPHDPAYIPVTERLMRAVLEDSDAFDLVIDEPHRENHVGYHNGTISAVVWSAEGDTLFHRLTIRPGLHPVFDDLAEIIRASLLP